MKFTPLPNADSQCSLCTDAGGVLLWRAGGWRVVRVDDVDYPAFYRVVCDRHVQEFSQVPQAQRERCMNLVCAVERVLIEHLHPTKINLATLGNITPHLHWHIIARFDTDRHFPQPVWAEPQRAPDLELLNRLTGQVKELDTAIVAALNALD